MNALFLRALFAFLALPGVIAFLLPLWLAPWSRSFAPGAILLLGPGVVLLMWCVREFYVSGRGTLAPWAPPTRLVVSGPYRWSRNPMYVGVALILAGWATGFRSAGLALYAICVVLAFQLRTVYGEEPWLARTHGAAWARYAARVPRWVGRAHQMDED